MTTFTNQTKPAASYTAQAKPRSSGALVFYGWMFLFTLPSRALAKVPKAAISFTSIAKP